MDLETSNHYNVSFEMIFMFFVAIKFPTASKSGLTNSYGWDLSGPSIAQSV